MVIEQLDTITLVQGDCMEFMAEMPDFKFDLAIVDPPYGIDAGSYKRGGTKVGNQLATCKEYHTGDWDKLPPHTHILLNCRELAKIKLFGEVTISLMTYTTPIA